MCRFYSRPLDKDIFSDEELLSSDLTDRPMVADPELPDIDIARPRAHCSSSSPNTDTPFVPDAAPQADTSINLLVPSVSCDAAPQGDTSINLLAHTVSSDAASPKMFASPEIFLGYPKAAPRKQTNRGKKRGKCMIATSSPMMEEIKLKQCIKSGDKSNVKKNLFDTDMTDDRTDSISNSSDSSDENIDVRMDSVESVNVNDYVLYEFEVGKKTKYLVGKVMKEEDDGDILFCKRVEKLVDKFFCQTVEDIGKVRNGQIKTILPPPVNCKEALVEMLCKFTNENAAATGPTKPSMYKNWKDIDVEEFYVFMGLLIYMGLVQVPNFKLYLNGKSLFNGIVACGTIISNRKGFPTELKNVKQWENVSKRGEMTWVRQDQVLAMQWRDNKTVSLVSTMPSANEFNYVNRRTKNNGVFEQLKVKQPKLVGDYNSFTGGVDKSDQLLNKYNMLRKTNKYWKTLFFQFIDITRVNSYILFQDWRKQNPDIEELHRSPYYSQLDFTIELIRELANIDDYDPVPTVEHMKLKTCHSILPAMVASKDRKNCKLCYSHHKIERKTRSMCSVCGTFLCFSPERNCLLLYHK
ncbi:piggyBac transposable element-derived protein 3 [Biomphalaria glabrata]|nr:piggyBac transposable element-derived protein 3 [Biomphalaria glabrata]